MAKAERAVSRHHGTAVWPARMFKRFSRRILGEATYLRLKEGLLGGRLESLEEEGQLERRFKRSVLESLARTRQLERELATLRYPELFDSELDVVAAVSRMGEVRTPWPGGVTVIVTNFNYGQYVGHAIESVLDQTHDQVELVVIDDNSTDLSVSVLTQVLKRVSSMPWQLVELKHNAGLPAARNIGIKLARGEFVFMLDADNHLLPRCVEAHIRAAQADHADAAYGVIRTFGTASGLLSDAPFSPERLAHGPYIDAMALFRRSSLLEIGMYNTEAALYGWEDYDLWLRFAGNGGRVTFIPSELSHYRLHDRNMVSLTSMDTREGWIYLLEGHAKVFGELSTDARAREAEKRARFVRRAGRVASNRGGGVNVACGCLSRSREEI